MPNNMEYGPFNQRESVVSILVHCLRRSFHIKQHWIFAESTCGCQE